MEWGWNCAPRIFDLTEIWCISVKTAKIHTGWAKGRKISGHSISITVDRSYKQLTFHSYYSVFICLDRHDRRRQRCRRRRPRRRHQVDGLSACHRIHNITVPNVDQNVICSNRKDRNISFQFKWVRRRFTLVAHRTLYTRRIPSIFTKCFGLRWRRH